MKVDLSALAKQIKERFNITLPEMTDSGEEWTDVALLNTLDGIGLSRTEKFGRLATTLSTIISRAKEFDGDGTVPIQQDVAGTPLRSNDGSVYIFRITDADAARPPTSVDEVRDQLVEDLRREKTLSAASHTARAD